MLGALDLTTAAGAALIATSLFTIPAVIDALDKRRKSKSKTTLYRDKDGVATEESMAKYSTTLPKSLLAIFITLGFFTAIALAVLSTIRQENRTTKVEDWMIVGSWALIVLQALSTILQKTTKSYTLGIYTSLSGTALVIALLFQDALLIRNPDIKSLGLPEFTVLRITQLVLAFFTVVAGLSIPRRPQVFHNGIPVDGMYSASAFGRYSFTWVAHLLQLAHSKKRLELEDFPAMDHYTRAKESTLEWESKERTKRLYIEVALAHKWAFIIQWLLTFIQSFGQFGPQFVNYHFLKLLEERDLGSPISQEAWIWVVALTIVNIGAAWIEAWLFWISWSELAIPIRAQLSALTFQKAMRRKDVKGVSKKKVPEGLNMSPVPMEDTIAEDKSEPPPPEDDKDNNLNKSKQSTINLIGVDSKRVADFCSFNYYFPGSLFKLIISFWFLISILGWKSLISGFLAMSLTIPINIFFTKRYAAAQDRLMKVRDVKMGVVTEALQGIRQIKFSALEVNWQEKIGKVRRKELGEQWSVYVSDTFLLFCWITSPVLLSATALAVYSSIEGELTPSVAFTAIGVFSSLELTLSVVPELTTDLIDAFISLTRIETYLNAPEVSKHTSDGSTIVFDDVSMAWPSDEEKCDGYERYVLRNVNISFPEGELSVISGKTGTGKSLLLAGVLGEVDLLSGTIYAPRTPHTRERRDHLATTANWIVPSAVAFVAQIPWIENASIKDNILFGLPFDEQRYDKVLEACALKKDLETLVDGENTEIGANGINLSGGQRWRVTFARALYSRAGILILDDIFSAVDAHVGRYLFEHALTGELGTGRTRILVTHHVSLVKSRTKYLVELGDGTVETAGFLTDLEEDGTLQKVLSNEELSSSGDDETTIDSTLKNFESKKHDLAKVDSKKQLAKFVEEEARERGRVKYQIYLSYMKASGGWPFWSIALFAFICGQFITTSRSWWLKVWTGNNATDEAISSSFNYAVQMQVFFPPMVGNSTNGMSTLDPQDNLSFYLGIYVALAIAAALIGTVRYFWIFCGSIRASRKLFDTLAFTILRTPLRWMDTVPLGRILNRFTADFNIIDSKLSNDLGFGASNLFRVIGVVVAGVLVSPYVLVLAVVLVAICVWIASLYLVGAREVKRLESSTKSPVFEQFGSALTGVGTIRAFGKSDVYIERMYKKIDDYNTTFWHLWVFNRWMGWRMSTIGGFFATVVAIIIILLPNIDAPLAGFALSFALDYGNSVIWAIRQATNLELDMNAAERIVEYSSLPIESQDGADPPAAWPSEGRLEFNNVVVSYAPDLPPVLKGLTFEIARNERVGVVGRTGAGKSSLTLALFRFLEATEGSIHIDGLDISKLKLQTLRSRLAIIPQDPVLFSGTVRTNLDAFDEHDDSELRDALERVHLITPSVNHTPSDPSSSSSVFEPQTSSNTNSNLFTSLTSPITEGGLNLSQGQRQLLCLARAIVSRPKIMVLDEATSAVDMETDTLIQRSIRGEFGDSTLIVIAHRLSTIVDFDKILVLDDGRVVEFGTPREIFHKKDGVFRGMVGESGEKEKLEHLILG
ncbi:putative ABC bile acid transporter [Calycina marina]|uniref:ABC bile acid transporter n=1 Tax=Calycina marina TaxID=1763456 RepID=A0A9P8CDQ1_9HELO|nr:putative ABC bile acid transporter [Calycina marina]